MTAQVLYAADYWADTGSLVTFIPSDEAPDLPVTAVKLYAFEKDSVLMAKVGRGWDLPGGHVEPNESPEAALVRELKEETGACIEKFSLVGYLRIINATQTERNRQYPAEACVLVYAGTGLAFDATYDVTQFESTDRKLVPIKDAGVFHHSWSELNRQVLAYTKGTVNEV